MQIERITYLKIKVLIEFLKTNFYYCYNILLTHYIQCIMLLVKENRSTNCIQHVSDLLFARYYIGKYIYIYI